MSKRRNWVGGDEALSLRVGTPDDVDEVMQLALSGSEENGFVDPSPVRLLAEIWPALNRDRGLLGVLHNPTGKIQGVVLLKIGKMWYSEQEVLEEKAIFIHPEYRGARGGRAKRLCEFSKQVADGLSIPLIIGVLSNTRTEGKIRLYERQFGKPSGAFFLYGATTGVLRENEHGR
jgi:hypothetical protein